MSRELPQSLHLAELTILEDPKQSRDHLYQDW